MCARSPSTFLKEPWLEDLDLSDSRVDATVLNVPSNTPWSVLPQHLREHLLHQLLLPPCKEHVRTPLAIKETAQPLLPLHLNPPPQRLLELQHFNPPPQRLLELQHFNPQLRHLREPLWVPAVLLADATTYQTQASVSTVEVCSNNSGRLATILESAPAPRVHLPRVPLNLPTLACPTVCVLQDFTLFLDNVKERATRSPAEIVPAKPVTACASVSQIPPHPLLYPPMRLPWRFCLVEMGASRALW